MVQRSLHSEKLHRQEGAEGWPFLAITTVVILGGYASALRQEPALRAPARLVPLTAFALAHAALYWLGPRFFQIERRPAAYLATQATLALAIGLLARGHWLVMGVLMGLAGQAVGVLWPRPWPIVLVVVLALSLSVLLFAWPQGGQQLLAIVPFLGFSVAFVLVYVILYVRQVQAREQAQALLRDLETAHRQLQAYAARVEELTISHERQRMARELHDTLAQGLAGLILQLEAADSHLEMDHAERAQETVQQAMARARTTLHEARRAIQALRPAALERGTLVEALGWEVDRIAEAADLRAAFQVDGSVIDVSPEVAQGILRIVQEGLANVSRHARAAHVVVRLQQRDDVLRVQVEDDGVGFDPAAERERAQGLGLRGMEERAQQIGARFAMESTPNRGTTITLEVRHQPVIHTGGS